MIDGVNNILLIRLKSMGDVVFTLPAVNLVRENFPKARITYLTSAENQPIVEGFAGVDEVLALDRKLYKKFNLKAISGATFDLLRRLRRGKFSLVVDFQNYGETALLARLTRAPQRWACCFGRKLRHAAYTHRLPRPNHVHPAEGHLQLLTHFGLRPAPVRNEFRLPDRGRAEARRLFAEYGLSPAKPTLFIQPFTSSPQKNWPLGNYVAVARHWKAKGVQVVFGGGPGEQRLLTPVIAGGFPVFAGNPLATVVWLMNFSTLTIGGDTGLLHLAVAMGRRVLVLMSPGGPGSPTPYLRNEWVVRPHGGRGVSEIKLEAVNRAIAAALAAEKP